MHVLNISDTTSGLEGPNHTLQCGRSDGVSQVRVNMEKKQKGKTKQAARNLRAFHFWRLDCALPGLFAREKLLISLTQRFWKMLIRESPHPQAIAAASLQAQLEGRVRTPGRGCALHVMRPVHRGWRSNERVGDALHRLNEVGAAGHRGCGQRSSFPSVESNRGHWDTSSHGRVPREGHGSSLKQVSSPSPSLSDAGDSGKRRCPELVAARGSDG